jgi:hemerythrin-like metal-binding protein/diguanylate cyclase (GGDEF)-like protein
MDYLKFLEKKNAIHQTEDKSLLDFYEMAISRMINAYALHKIILDEDGNPCDYVFIDVNPSFESITGLKKSNILGRKISEIIPNISQDVFDWIGVYGNVAIKGEPISFESFSIPLDKWFLISAYSPKTNYFVTVFNDISQIKRVELELLQKKDILSNLQRNLHYWESHDALTGLPNRVSLCNDINIKLKSNPNSGLAVASIDFSNLKLINSTYGYALGDEFLIEVGNRLSSLFHNEGKIYRMNGPEFCLLLNSFASEDEVNACAEKVIQCFKSPLIMGGIKSHTTVNIGIALSLDERNTAEELIRNADIARNTAKTIGKNKHVVYKDELYKVIIERMILEKQLHSALDNNEFEIYYQPQLDLATKKICGFEALLRWHNPELGTVSPTDFIPIAESNDLIVPIGAWVLRNACFFIKKLKNKGYTDFTISVNVSLVQLIRDDFVDSVLSIIELIGLDPKHLELEITESVFVESYESVHKKLEYLRKSGIKIAMDDFGKGYSSLSELQYLPVDILKIDKVFIDSILNKDRCICITDMIILLGRKMGMTVLAEGVETQEQMDYLVQNHCDRMQGYLFSKPLAEREILEKFFSNLESESLLSQFEWKTKYSVGIDSIDSQHKRMFEIGNRLSKLVFSEEPFDYNNELISIFQELNEYIDRHFKYEETYMKKHGYIYLESHVIMHNAFIEKVEKAYNTANNNKGQDHFMYLIDMVSSWITNHILTEDVKFGRFLSKKHKLKQN